MSETENQRTVSELDVRSWLLRLLIDDAGFTKEEAERAATACSQWRGAFSLTKAITAAIAARTTSQLPGGRRWWSGAGQWAKDYLLAGMVDEATYGIAEILAEPAPDAWDPNWPESKRFAVVPLPEGAAIGDEFVVGNGEGHRGRFRVDERNGRIGAMLLVARWSLSDLWDTADREAEALLRS